MKLLPNGCTCSEPSIHPANYKTCSTSALKKKWYVQYYFYDPSIRKNGKLVIIKSGINRLKSLAERRAAAEALLNDEIYRLESGYNAITNTFTAVISDFEIPPETPAGQAIQMAADRFKGAERTITDVKFAAQYFCEALLRCKQYNTPVANLKRRHIKQVLENLSQYKNYSNKRYNKIRAYLQIIYSELVDADTIEVNPISAIKKKKETKTLKTVLSKDEFLKVMQHLKANYYTFYRFSIIFFHSGSRTTEMMRIKKKDVDFKTNTFKVLVLKGRSYEEQLRPINFKVLSLWHELVNESIDNDYLFSENLQPGPVEIKSRQISIRWRKHVKNKLNIEVDFYALKHLHTDLIDTVLGTEMASAYNGHKSTKMVNDHYAVSKKQRMLQQMQKIDLGV